MWCHRSCDGRGHLWWRLFIAVVLSAPLIMVSGVASVADAAPARPVRVMLGRNDLDWGDTALEVATEMAAYVESVHVALPKTRVIVAQAVAQAIHRLGVLPARPRVYRHVALNPRARIVVQQRRHRLRIVWNPYRFRYDAKVVVRRVDGGRRA